MTNQYSTNKSAFSIYEGKKSSPTCEFTSHTARREKTVGFVLNSGAA